MSTPRTAAIFRACLQPPLERECSGRAGPSGRTRNGAALPLMSRRRSDAGDSILNRPFSIIPFNPRLCRPSQKHWYQRESSTRLLGFLAMFRPWTKSVRRKRRCPDRQAQFLLSKWRAGVSADYLGGPACEGVRTAKSRSAYCNKDQHFLHLIFDIRNR